MVQAGVGVDMLEIARMESVMRRRPHFLDAVFTEDERAYCDATARPAEHYAARFAAREAVLKSLGTGFSGGVGLKDVSVGRSELGRPLCILAGRAAEVAQGQGVQEIALSLSTTREVAVANAVAVTEEARPHREEVPDPAKELRASFKRARTLIAELERLQGAMSDTLEATVEDEASEQPAEAPVRTGA